MSTATSPHATDLQPSARIIAFPGRAGRAALGHPAVAEPSYTRPDRPAGVGATTTGSLLAWHMADHFVMGRAYREVPSDRLGYYVGPAEVPALDRLHGSIVVLVFRCVHTGQLFTYSEFDAQSGVAYEEVAG